MKPASGETVAEVFASLLGEAETALRAVAKLSITNRQSRGILGAEDGFDFCNLCLMAALDGRPVNHAASCPVGVAASLADRIHLATTAKPLFSATEIAAMRLLNLPERRIQYEDGRDEAVVAQ